MVYRKATEKDLAEIIDMKNRVKEQIIRALTGIPILTAALPVVGGVILVLISVILTTVAGLIPSFSAAKKDPVVALRTE